MAVALTWSFFVLCTPVADAGILLDFPLRLLFGIRMIVSELAVWALAIVLNLATLMLAPEYYQTTFLTRIFWGNPAHAMALLGRDPPVRDWHIPLGALW